MKFELDVDLIYLLRSAGWVDHEWKPTAKLMTAAKKAMEVSPPGIP